MGDSTAVAQGIPTGGQPVPSPAPSAAAPAEAPTQPVFGQLESMRIRDYWKDEARDFTPWLAKEDNLGLLGDTIGLNLELVGMEMAVGPFRADIVAQDEDHRVIVENQLDATDHKHLGQLLVYAAGREARTVVWIARQISDEYRKVIDWLNQETSTNFWALEIELWRIGDSPVAPKFNIVCEPNELTKSTDEETAELSGTRLLQLEFWKGFSEHLDDSNSSFNSRKAQPQNWYSLSIGTARAYVSCTVLMSSSGRLGCELYIPGRSQADEIFAGLLTEKEAIEAELGELDWQDLPDRKACRIADYKQPVDLVDSEAWPELFDWLKSRAEAFKTSFAQRIKDIDLPDLTDAAGAVSTGEEDPGATDAATNGFGGTPAVEADVS